MSIVACLDLETTSLDVNKCSITEIAVVIYDTVNKTVLDSSDFFVLPYAQGERISEEASRLTGITDSLIQARGIAPQYAIESLARMLTRYQTPTVHYIAAHNGKNFDEPIFKRFLMNYVVSSAEQKSNKLFNDIEIIGSLKWIDTMTDIPYPDNITTRKLTYVCLEHGYMISNAHRALYDALGVAHLLGCYDFDTVKQYNESEDVTLVAEVQKPWLDGGKSTTEAKKFGFRFNGETKEWFTTVKSFMLNDFVQSLPFSTRSEQLSLKLD